MNAAAPVSAFKNRLREILAGKRPAFAVVERVIEPPSPNLIDEAKTLLAATDERLVAMVRARDQSDGATARERDLEQTDLAGLLAAGIEIPNPHALASMASGSLVIVRANRQALDTMAPAAVAAVRTLRNWHLHCLTEARANLTKTITDSLPDHLPKSALDLIVSDDPRVRAIEDEARELNLTNHFNIPTVLIDGDKYRFPAWRVDPAPAKSRIAWQDTWNPAAVATSIRAGLGRVQTAEILLSNSLPPSPPNEQPAGMTTEKGAAK